RCATASACCTPGVSSRRGRSSRSSTTRAIRTRSACCGACRAGGAQSAAALLRCLPRGGVRKARERLDTIPGFLPQLGADLPACVFVDRCGLAQDICRTQEPPFHDLESDHTSRCHFWERAQTLPRATPAAGVHPPRAQDDGDPVIRTEGMNKTFRQEGHEIRAVDDISLVLGRGETLGLVGESGSGKTTLARAL